jgi:hypothetical protein
MKDSGAPMKSDQAAELVEAEGQVLKEQRELAQACAFLAVAISVAVLLSNFGGVPKETLAARKAVEEHRVLLKQAEDLLAVNSQELVNVQTSLRDIKAALQKR